jgi:hypothetical protein
MEAQGQAPAQPATPQSPQDYVAAALEADEPRFSREQDIANHPEKRHEDEDKEQPEAKEPEATESGSTKEEEQQTEQEEETVELDLDAPLVEVKLKTDKGEETRKLSINELRKGHMMQADYQRKTAELARLRESLHQEVEAKTKPALETYEKNLKQLQAAVIATAAPEFQGMDASKWHQLAVENPAEYVAKKARFDQIGQTLQHINGQMQQLETAKAHEASQAKQKAIQEAVETLQRDIPDWSTTKYQDLMKFGVERGYSPQEIAEIHDPRIFKLLDVAQKYEALQKAKPEVEKKVAKAPKVLKPGTSDAKDSKADVREERFKRLSKEGSREAAAAFIETLL